MHIDKVMQLVGNRKQKTYICLYLFLSASQCTVGKSSEEEINLTLRNQKCTLVARRKHIGNGDSNYIH
jgi:hypothetical protein